jgi:hypothetical protein
MKTMMVMKRAVMFVMLATTIGSASACVVREREYARGPGPRGCAGGVWVEGHRGPAGRWHEGHWRCPGVVERIEID